MSRLEIATAGCFILGAGLLFPFDYTITILAGVLLLIAFVVCGLFLLASPERLKDSPLTGRQPAAARPGGRRPRRRRPPR